jgi:Gram-negative bacterial tonB protein.
MKKAILFTVLLSAMAMLSVPAVSAQKRVLSEERIISILEKYKEKYPEGISLYYVIQHKPTYKGGGLEKLKDRIAARSDNYDFVPGSTTIYSFVVGKNGKVKDVEVSGPNEKQNKIVEKAIKGTRWKPGQVDGEAVDVLVIASLALVE